jgi:hypothetical protein
VVKALLHSTAKKVMYVKGGNEPINKTFQRLSGLILSLP